MENQNNTPHWSEAELMDRLYGLDPSPSHAESHLSECAECARRWVALEARRSALLAAPVAVAEERIRAQRQAIWARLEYPQRQGIWRAVPAVATALVLLVGVALHQGPAPAPQPANIASANLVSDEQFFNEIASVVSQHTPRAADPIRGLFTEDAKTEAQ